MTGIVANITVTGISSEHFYSHSALFKMQVTLAAEKQSFADQFKKVSKFKVSKPKTNLAEANKFANDL